MSMMIHRKREALRLKERAEQLRNVESSTPDVVTEADVNDTASVVNNVEEGEDVTDPAPVKRGRKKKV